MRLASVLFLMTLSMQLIPRNPGQQIAQGMFSQTGDAGLADQVNQTQIWVTAPSWMSDLKSLLTLPSDEPILKQVIKSEIYKNENHGKYADALEILKVGLILYPRDALFPYRMGMILAVFQPSQAQQYLALAKDEDQSLAVTANPVIQFVETTPVSEALDSVHLGQVMGRVNEWKLADTLFTRAVETNPQLADAWALLGQVRVMLGGDGYNQLSKALSVNPTSPVGLALMSMYWKNHQRIDLALDYMRLLNSLQTDQISWVFELGNLNALNQDLEAAFSDYLQATVMAPKDPTTWQNLAIFCLNYSVHLEDVGLPAVRTLMEMKPDDPLSLTLMGQGLLKQGDRDTAERFLLRAVQKAPANTTARYFLGYLYISENNKSFAFPELVKVIEMDGSSGYGPMARRLLEEIFGPN